MTSRTDTMTRRTDGQHERVAADADREDGRCAEDPQRGDHVQTTAVATIVAAATAAVRR